jgi:hypothetical protein
MSTIKISDLQPTGAELFSDSESYMNELGTDELVDINGGISTPVCVSVAATLVSVIVTIHTAASYLATRRLASY